jgi:hypothetical protein
MQQLQLVENHADCWRKIQQTANIFHDSLERMTLNFRAQRHEYERNSNISHTNFAVGFGEKKENLQSAMAVKNGLLSFVGKQICKGAGIILPDLVVFFYG